MHEKYFGAITHPRLKEQIAIEIDAWNQGHFGAIRQRAEAEQRLELGQNTFQSSFEEINELLSTEQISKEEGIKRLNELAHFVRTSESIAMSEDDLGRFVNELQEFNGQEDNSLVAEALENSELISIGHRADLKKRKDRVNAMSGAKLELKRLEMQGTIDQLMDRNQLTRAWFKPYVAKGIYTNAQVENYLHKQQKVQEQFVTQNNYLINFNDERLKFLKPKDQQDAMAFAHSHYLQRYGEEEGQRRFDIKLRNSGVVYKPYVSTLSAGLGATGTQLNSEKDISQNTLQGVAMYKRLKAYGSVDLYLSEKESIAYAAIVAETEMGTPLHQAINNYTDAENNPNRQYTRPKAFELRAFGEKVADAIKTEAWSDFSDSQIKGLLTSKAQSLYIQALARGLAPDLAEETILNRMQTTYAIVNGAIFNKRLFGFNFDADDIGKRTDVLIDYLHKNNPAIDKDVDLTVSPREGGLFQVINKVSGLPYFDNDGRGYLISFNDFMGEGEGAISDMMKEAAYKRMQAEVTKNQIEAERNKPEPIIPHSPAGRLLY